MKNLTTKPLFPSLIFSPWIAIQPKTENGNIVLETTSLFSSDQLTKMSLLANQTNRLSKVLSSLPISVAGAEIYSFDYESFNRNSDRYNAQQNLPNHPLDSLLIKSQCNCNYLYYQKSNCCSRPDRL